MAFHACVVLCDPIASGGKMYDLGDMSVSTVLLTCHGYGWVANMSWMYTVLSWRCTVLSWIWLYTTEHVHTHNKKCRWQCPVLKSMKRKLGIDKQSIRHLGIDKVLRNRYSKRGNRFNPDIKFILFLGQCSIHRCTACTGDVTNDDGHFTSATLLWSQIKTMAVSSWACSIWTAYK